ncbi:MAG TPA: type II toxin-antitoxin system RelE/ParE family toxin [Caulobacteraceae bacterium]|jgi:hypothetical protein|nr:type II toxin-antitoxin system RelE/ParE family toxin [Caulobacteraceae bacterium]
MDWTVEFHADFAVEFMALNEEVQDELAAYVELLKVIGPQLRRPYADTLNGSTHANMRELRFEAADGVWRVAYAFDPDRKAILLVAGDKSGVSQRRFYASLIRKADQRYEAHLRARRKT